MNWSTFYQAIDEETIKSVAFKFVSQDALVTALVRTVEGTTRGFVATKRQAEILALRGEIVQEAKSQLDDHLLGWGYHLLDLQLNDITFECGPGTTTAIVGSTGAGKTTLVSLIPRLFDVSAGAVFVDGCDVREIDHEVLSARIGYVPQQLSIEGALTGRENVFLNGTLLGMRKKEITRRFDEIVAFADVERFLETQVKRYSTGGSRRSSR